MFYIDITLVHLEFTCKCNYLGFPTAILQYVHMNVAMSAIDLLPRLMRDNFIIFHKEKT
jgi:hypothetical protein